MSSLRNAVKRVTHKERSQPRSRQRLGILEKKKDYKQRAEDYHRKEDRIRGMQERAAMRNPDEFYFGMKSSKVKNGKHERLQSKDPTNLSPDVIKLMKDQDLSFIRMQKQKDRKRAEKMKTSLHLLDSGKEAQQVSKRRHTVFVQTERDAKRFKVEDHFDTLPGFAGRAFNRLRKKDVEKMIQTKKDHSENDSHIHHVTVEHLEKELTRKRKVAKRITKARSAAYGELEARLSRAKVLEKAESHLVTEKLVAGKGRRRKIAAAEKGRPAQYKWRRERKK